MGDMRGNRDEKLDEAFRPIKEKTGWTFLRQNHHNRLTDVEITDTKGNTQSRIFYYQENNKKWMLIKGNTLVDITLENIKSGS